MVVGTPATWQASVLSDSAKIGGCPGGFGWSTRLYSPSGSRSGCRWPQVQSLSPSKRKWIGNAHVRVRFARPSAPARRAAYKEPGEVLRDELEDDENPTSKLTAEATVGEMANCLKRRKIRAKTWPQPLANCVRRSAGFPRLCLAPTKIRVAEPTPGSLRPGRAHGGHWHSGEREKKVSHTLTERDFISFPPPYLFFIIVNHPVSAQPCPHRTDHRLTPRFSSPEIEIAASSLVLVPTRTIYNQHIMAMNLRTSARAIGSFKPLARAALGGARAYATAEPDLKATLKAAIPEKRELLKKVRAHGDKVIGEVKVENTLGGMRGLKAMVWEGSVLDANEGIRFHGRTIKECQQALPKGTSGTEMLPEAMFWLLLTGQVPSVAQVRVFSRELAEQAAIPAFVSKMLDDFPRDLHPMTQFAMAVSALNYESKFAKAYEKGLNKADYWEPTFDDSISLLAKLPTIAAKIYQNAYKGGGALPAEVDLNQDWSYNYAALLGKGGKENENFQDLLRLYLALHGDHEGGNVSAHATHLVGSALSDPFLSYSAGLQGLAGPLHGYVALIQKKGEKKRLTLYYSLAAQEVLRWILQMKENIPADHTEKDVEDYLWSTLNSGRVVPGYGHAVLRKPDPRFEALMDYAAARPEIAADPVFQLVEKNSRIAPEVLKKHGKTKNPYPNVDSSSGVLFHHYGFHETLYYTATFGVSRGLGPLAQLIWDRALGLPIERPKSINLAGLLKQVEGN
ncbi:2-methylcitrate synthase [Cordyceps militaris CM01]|uniref:Citrate synthase n=1 Tax=Cordyceps militaris (strain CM01) TaxID=983644 RepID=G3JGY2_CORMM|nr:2-methylcitrate synthase [Cordyceps militaris CM01]EGX91538.1 2-methylcitrate synthase [Cordyceps militaris CM01]